MILSADRWTVVARRVVRPSGDQWAWVEGALPAALCAASDADEVILMHRHHAGGVDLVARLAGPVWRRWRRWVGMRGHRSSAKRMA